MDHLFADTENICIFALDNAGWIRRLADRRAHKEERQNVLNNILRGGAVAARWAHNPKVGGSNPPSATKKKPGRPKADLAFLFSG